MDEVTVEPLIHQIQATIDSVLAPLLPQSGAVALIDFPAHHNLGDHAIWLGETAHLSARGLVTTYKCDRFHYSRELLARRLNGGPILLQGGGSVGDLYPAVQAFREDVISSFPENRIIQLPQTIHFRERGNANRAREIFEQHPDLTLLVRDRASLEFARTQLGAAAELCPDMAFMLGPLRRPEIPRSTIVWLARTDIESLGQTVPPGIITFDWPADSWGFRTRIEYTSMRRLSQIAGSRAGRFFTRSKSARRWLTHSFDPISRAMVKSASMLLSRGEVVVTDRLHGHILSLLLGVPHVLLDNSYGKLSDFYETWTRGARLARLASSPSEALELAAKMRGVQPGFA